MLPQLNCEPVTAPTRESLDTFGEFPRISPCDGHLISKFLVTTNLEGVFMSFGEAVKSGFSNYANFKGRASRSEFWWFYLFTILVSLILNVIDMAAGFTYGGSEVDISGTIYSVPGTGVLTTIWTLVVLLPILGLMARRLHDTDRTGWWILWGILLSVLCFIGVIILIVFLASKGTPADNRYGPPVTHNKV